MTYAKDITGDVSVDTLLNMLTYRRPASSATEEAFIAAYIRPLGVTEDTSGNLIKRIGDASVLWSSHTDTVHREGGRQLICTGDGEVWLGETDKSNCLGADDTAGVWLMREMILAKRPGLYIFHRGEECGGVGSSHIAFHMPELLDGIQWAIALDRAGRSDVITSQAGGRCCSDVFALALAAKLGIGFQPDSGGVFTDTANYTDLVGECTNISVGYFKQHTSQEYLDLRFVTALRDVLLTLDTYDLPSVRKPAEIDPDDAFFNSNWKDGGAIGQRTMAEIIREYPDEVADLLMAYGITKDELLTEIFDRGRLPF
jgi:hypothetical protein